MPASGIGIIGITQRQNDDVDFAVPPEKLFETFGVWGSSKWTIQNLTMTSCVAPLIAHRLLQTSNGPATQINANPSRAQYM